MTTRNEYVEQLKQKLDVWNEDLGRLEARAKVARTDLQIDYEMGLEKLRQQRDEAAAKLKALQASSEDAWRDLAAGAETAWGAMREAMDKAVSHFNR
ncbi:MAG: hypothetical protein AB1421_00020 [Pseudomonadota bacterium]